MASQVFYACTKQILVDTGYLVIHIDKEVNPFLVWSPNANPCNAISSGQLAVI